MPALRILTAVAAFTVLTSSTSAQVGQEQQPASELRLVPDRPTPGARVTVEYFANADLAAERTLVLRARLRTVATGIGLHHEMIAELERSAEGGYRGGFELPDSVVYAVFAVEDGAGRRVDHNGEMWELVVHGNDGRPLSDALDQRVRDLAERDKRLAYEATQAFVRLYPGHVMSWMTLYLYGSAPGAAPDKDSIRAVHAERFHAFSERLRAVSRPTAKEMTNLVFYGSWVGDTTASRAWRSRLIDEYPIHPFSVQQRVFALNEAHNRDASALMNAYEALWQEVGPAGPQLPFSAFSLAQRQGDAEAMLRWGRRLEQMQPAMLPFIAQSLLGQRELRDEALVRVREQIRRLQRPSDLDRPLTWTRDAYRNYMQRGAGIWLGRLGRALYETGELRAALDTLERAEEVWNVDSFRMIADLRLSMGDTIAAAAVLARVAADPATPSSFADSAQTRLGTHFDPERWANAIRAAHEELRAYIREQAISRELRSHRVLLQDAAGQPYMFEAGRGGVTLVVFWSRHCQPSFMQLAQFNDLAERLVREGVQVLAVTDEKPSADLTSFMTINRYTFPVFHDLSEAARQAFDTSLTPTYIVLDGAGRIRFESHVPDDVIRQVTVLQARDPSGA